MRGAYPVARPGFEERPCRDDGLQASAAFRIAEKFCKHDRRDVKPPICERCLDQIGVAGLLALKVGDQTAGVGGNHFSIFELAQRHQVDAELNFASQFAGLVLGPY